jgi:hypothetical protein
LRIVRKRRKNRALARAKNSATTNPRMSRNFALIYPVFFSPSSLITFCKSDHTAARVALV